MSTWAQFMGSDKGRIAVRKAGALNTPFVAVRWSAIKPEGQFEIRWWDYGVTSMESSAWQQQLQTHSRSVDSSRKRPCPVMH